KASATRASLLRFGFIGAGLIGAASLVWMFSRQQEIPMALGSYSYVDGTIFVTGKGGGTFNVGDYTSVQLNDQPVTEEKARTQVLSSKLQVTSLTLQPNIKGR